jgi:hypothetical protein
VRFGSDSRSDRYWLLKLRPYLASRPYLAFPIWPSTLFGLPAIWLADVLARVNDTPEHELADLLPDRWKLLHENDAIRQIESAAARRREFAVTHRP